MSSPTLHAIPGPAPIAPGIAIALYNGDRPDRALLAEVHDLLAHAKPDIVIVHGGPRALVGLDPEHPASEGIPALAGELRDLLPNVRLWMGVGCDGWTDYAAAHPNPAGLECAVGWLAAAANTAAGYGFELVMWDAESSSEAHRDVGEQIAHALLPRVGDTHPTLAQAFTSFPRPSVQPRLPWTAWHALPVRLTVPQCYVTDGSYTASVGALDAAIAESDHDMDRAVATGLIPSGIDRGVYLQIHNTPKRDTIRAATSKAIACLWGAPGEWDEDGRIAARAACAIRHAGFVGPDAVARFQQSRGIQVDNIAGDRETIPAALREE